MNLLDRLVSVYSTSALVRRPRQAKDDCPNKVNWDVCWPAVTSVLDGMLIRIHRTSRGQHCCRYDPSRRVHAWQKALADRRKKNKFIVLYLNFHARMHGGLPVYRTYLTWTVCGRNTVHLLSLVSGLIIEADCKTRFCKGSEEDQLMHSYLMGCLVGQVECVQ